MGTQRVRPTGHRRLRRPGRAHADLPGPDVLEAGSLSPRRRWRSSAAALAFAAAACAPDLTAPDPSIVFIDVVAGGAHTCALDEEGQAWCWGSNSHGQLGVSTRVELASRPVRAEASTPFRQLSLGTRHSCGVDRESRVWCWGANDTGQLGDGTSERRRSRPGPAALDLDVGHVSAGGAHTCATSASGGMWCWGLNDFGQLGEPRVGPAGSRVPLLAAGGMPFSSAAAGDRHTCGVSTLAGGLCWGRNDHGELGAATDHDTALPVRTAGSHLFRRLTAGRHHTCGLTGRDDVVCWGSNERGELGAGYRAGAGTPLPVPGVSTVSGVSTAPGGALTCVAGLDGVVCWGGYSLDGPAYRTTPHRVEGLPAELATAVAVGDAHACALVGGRIFCWGEGGSGQLGDGRRRSAISPVAVTP